MTEKDTSGENGQPIEWDPLEARIARLEAAFSRILAHLDPHGASQTLRSQDDPSTSLGRAP